MNYLDEEIYSKVVPDRIDPLAIRLNPFSPSLRADLGQERIGESESQKQTPKSTKET